MDPRTRLGKSLLLVRKELTAVEKEKADPDSVVFHNGCLLLYDLRGEIQFLQYADCYGNLIEQAYGLEENFSYTGEIKNGRELFFGRERIVKLLKKMQEE